MDKKGDFVSTIMIIVFVFALAIGFLFLSKINDAIMPEIAGQIGVYDAQAGNMTRIVADTTNNLLDFLFVFFTIGTFIVAIVLLYLLDVPPVFAIFFLILIGGIALSLSVIFSNVYEAMTLEPELNASALKLHMQNWIMSQYPLTVFIMVAIGVIVLYAKSRGQSQQIY